MKTTAGTIVLELYNETPLHRDNFLQNVRDKKYDGTLFHRVIADFMVQGGDHMSVGAAPGVLLGDSPEDKTIPAEFLAPKLYHKRGALAAARESDDVNPEKASSQYQYYIVWGKTYTDEQLDKVAQSIQRMTGGTYEMPDSLRQYYKEHPGTPHLDGSYTVFGELVKGLDVVEKIQSVKTDQNDRPIEDIKVLSARITRKL